MAQKGIFMNFSPLNDPEFNEYKEQRKRSANKKRRRKMLLGLVCVTVILATGFVLLFLAAWDTFPGLFHSSTESPTPTEELPSEPSPVTSPVPFLSPTVSTPDDPSDTTSGGDSGTASSPVLRKTTIYLDAGHGFFNANGVMDYGSGEDTIYQQLAEELTGQKLTEADLNLAITLKVGRILEEKGYTVLLSRTDYMQKRLPINARAAMVRDAGADVLVSIHANYSKYPAAYGTRIYYNGDGSTYSKAFESQMFASAMAQEIDAAGASSKTTQIYSSPELAMLNGTGNIPSVLVETCFLTNENDAKAALTEEWQEKIAGAIAETILKKYPLEIRYI